MKIAESYQSGNRLIAIKDEMFEEPIVLTPEEAEEMAEKLNKIV